MRSWRLHLSVAVLAVTAMALALTPAIADPLPGTDEYPDVVFLARNDVPFDAQTAASMAAQLGAPIFITNSGFLSDAARDGIQDRNPDVIIVAGGPVAVSNAVADDAADQCTPTCTIDRRGGEDRDETAAILADIAADYGFDRPVLQGAEQVVGDVHVGGTLNVDDLTIQDTDMVAGLNADRLDDLHASDLVSTASQETKSSSTSLSGATSSATAETVLTLADLPPGTYVLIGQIGGHTQSTDESRIVCDTTLGSETSRTIGRIGTTAGFTGQDQWPVTLVTTIPATSSATIECWAEALTGGAPFIGTNTRLVALQLGG